MGKGAIISGGNDGLYSIKLNLNRDRVETLLGIIDKQIAALSAKLAGMEEGKEKEIVKLKQSSYEKKKEYLQNNQSEDPVVSAWCADLTENISGDVGTIEIPGERGVVQIQPGHESNSAYNVARDGQLQAAVAGTPESVFYNLAMLPGWQKWMPVFRHGIISNIDTDADTCDVTLDVVESSQQGLIVVPFDRKLLNVSIEYMSCNSIAFENGDTVLVKFEGQKWTGAKVVGFKTNPKVCEFYINITVNEFIPAYYKILKIIDNDGIVHIKESTPEEPSKAGPFKNVAFPAKVYLYMDGHAPYTENDTDMLFSYFTEDPVKEFTVCVETLVEGSTIAVDGIVLGNGDQQKFSWDFSSKTWSAISGGISDDTTLFLANKTNPTSTGYNQACKKEVVNAYEGTRILLTQEGAGEPQTMGEIYEYVLSAKRIHDWPDTCDLYRPYYGLVENEPVYEPPLLDTEYETYYSENVYRVAYLLTDDDEIEKIPKDPINFTASRLGSLLVKNTIPADLTETCPSCEWPVEEKTWTGNPDDITYNAYPFPNSSGFLIVGVLTEWLGAYYWETPEDCVYISGAHTWCDGTVDSTYCYRSCSQKIGVVEISQMAIMTDSDGHNPVFGEASLNIDHTGQYAVCQSSDDGWETYTDICLSEIPLNAGARIYEFREISTPENRI